jgi:hypothetical protein
MVYKGLRASYRCARLINHYRHLLRLGAGEKELATAKDFSKAGRCVVSTYTILNVYYTNRSISCSMQHHCVLITAGIITRQHHQRDDTLAAVLIAVCSTVCVLSTAASNARQRQQ